MKTVKKDGSECANRCELQFGSQLNNLDADLYFLYLKGRIALMAELKLVHSTEAQQQAAFNALYPELVAAVQQYVPAFFQYQVMQGLKTPETKAKIMKMIDDALDAALSVSTA